MRRMLAEPVPVIPRPPEPSTEAVAIGQELAPNNAEQLAMLLATAIQRMRSRV
jgi:hypothetical protein